MKKILAAGLLCVMVMAAPAYAKAAGAICYAGGCNFGECFMDADYDGICGNHYFFDANGDGVCDYHFYWDANGDGICDLFIDGNQDGICDHCHDHGRPVQATTAVMAAPQGAVVAAPQSPVVAAPQGTVVTAQPSPVTYTYNYGGNYYGGHHGRGGHHGGCH